MVGTEYGIALLACVFEVVPGEDEQPVVKDSAKRHRKDADFNARLG